MLRRWSSRKKRFVDATSYIKTRVVFTVFFVLTSLQARDELEDVINELLQGDGQHPEEEVLSEIIIGETGEEDHHHHHHDDQDHEVIVEAPEDDDDDHDDDDDAHDDGDHDDSQMVTQPITDDEDDQQGKCMRTLREVQVN